MEYGKNYFNMMTEINSLVENYEIASVAGLCDSILGINIPIITLGEGETKIVYLGGEIGCDSLSPYILTRFARDICALHKEGGAVFGFSAEYILKKYTIIIIPMLNPDGASYCESGPSADNPIKERVLSLNGQNSDFSKWKGNARGVDLRFCYETEDSDTEPEIEVGNLCNLLKFWVDPRMIFSLYQGEQRNSFIYYGDGEQASKVATALSQMTGFNRAFLDDGEGKTLMAWSRRELGVKSFLVEISNEKSCIEGTGRNLDFTKYLQLRKMLFCAPLLTKIK